MTPTNDAPVTVELPAVCDGKEQHAFEEWAKGQRFDMTEHPLYYLFLNARTDAARDGWKAGLTYASRLAGLASAPAGDGVEEGEPAPWAIAAERAASDAYAQHMGLPEESDPTAGQRAAALAIERYAAAALARPRAAVGKRPDDEALDPHLPDTVKSERRCGIQRSDWMTSWFVPWSPRNDNQNAEGPWSHWVALAHAIIAADEKAILALYSPPAKVEG